jgi:hypothetical protein
MRCAVLLLAVSMLGFAPAPLPRPAKPGPISVEGTSWSGTDSEGSRYTFRFLPGGVLDYTSPTGTFRNGSWKQTGETLYMETNNRYWELSGVIKGDSLQGKATNVRGGTWTYQLKKDPKMGKEAERSGRLAPKRRER